MLTCNPPALAVGKYQQRCVALIANRPTSRFLSNLSHIRIRLSVSFTYTYAHHGYRIRGMQEWTENRPCCRTCLSLLPVGLDFAQIAKQLASGPAEPKPFLERYLVDFVRRRTREPIPPLSLSLVTAGYLITIILGSFL